MKVSLDSSWSLHPAVYLIKTYTVPVTRANQRNLWHKPVFVFNRSIFWCWLRLCGTWVRFCSLRLYQVHLHFLMKWSFKKWFASENELLAGVKVNKLRVFKALENMVQPYLLDECPPYHIKSECKWSDF